MNGEVLLGTYTLKMTDKNVSIYQSYMLEFQPENIVSCPELGQEGRYYYHNDYLMIGFADTQQDLNFPTKVMLFGKFNGYNQFSGVIGNGEGTQVSGWVAEPGHCDPMVAPDFGPIYELNRMNFRGLEDPNNVDAIFHFKQENSVNRVDYGTFQGGLQLTGNYHTLRYDDSSEQLLVFASNRMIIYGAVVEAVGDKLQLKQGMYMNPFSGAGYFNTWHAETYP